MGVFKRYALVISFIAASILLVSGLAYVAGLLGIERGDPRLLATQILVTAHPPLPGTPVARFAQIDPAIVPYLDNRQPSYGVIPLDALGEGIQPVGAYLPQTGNTRFDLPTDTSMTRPVTLAVTITPLISPSPTSIVHTPVQPTLLPPTAIPPAAVPATQIPPPPVSIMIVPTAVPPPIAEAQIVEVPIPQVPDVTVQPPVLATATELVNVNPTSPPPVPQTADCAPAGLPTSGVLTQRFHQFHIGIDIGVPLGTPLRATHSGTVIEAGWNNGGYGNVVAIKNGAFSTYYGHQTSVNVAAGQFVRQGDVIGWSGSTGNSNGPHVHYETRINDVPVDPLTFDSRGYPTC
jgi:Peptidase family M23